MGSCSYFLETQVAAFMQNMLYWEAGGYIKCTWYSHVANCHPINRDCYKGTGTATINLPALSPCDVQVPLSGSFTPCLKMLPFSGSIPSIVFFVYRVIFHNDVNKMPAKTKFFDVCRDHGTLPKSLVTRYWTCEYRLSKLLAWSMFVCWTYVIWKHIRNLRAVINYT